MARRTICVIFHSDPRTDLCSAWRLLAGISPSGGCAVLGGGRGGSCRGLASARWGTKLWCGPPSLVHVHSTTPDSRDHSCTYERPGPPGPGKRPRVGQCELQQGQHLPPGAEQDVVALGRDHRAGPDRHLLLFFRGCHPLLMSAPQRPWGSRCSSPHFCSDPPLLSPSLPPASGPVAAQDRSSLTLVLAFAL